MMFEQPMPAIETNLPCEAGDVVVHSLHPSHFHCFCYKLYFLSSFKDFHTMAPAC